MQNILETLAWSSPEPHPVAGTTLYLKIAPALPAFWDEYRGFEEEWYAIGISISKRGMQWYVKWWSNDAGEFQTVRPPKIAKSSAIASALSKKKP